jgi:hypothetical protein
MRAAIACLLCLPIVACTTPQYVLKNRDTGQIVVCGGSDTAATLFGVVGYQVQKSNDIRCVEAYQTNGFNVIHNSQFDVAGKRTTK